MSRKPLLRSTFLCALLAATAGAPAAGPEVRSFVLQGIGVLDLPVPPDWRQEVGSDPASGASTLEFLPASDDAFRLQLTFLRETEDSRLAANPEVLQPQAEELARAPLPAGGPPPALEEVRGAGLLAYLAAVDDPESSSYPHRTVGVAGAGDLRVRVNLLARRRPSAADAALRDLLRGFRVRAETEAADEIPIPRAQEVRLGYPGRDWWVSVELPGFVVGPKRMYPNQTGVRVGATNEETGMVVSIFLERAPQDGDAVACRDYYWERARRSALPRSDVRPYERPGMACMEWTVRYAEGRDVDQRHRSACLSRDGVWIEVHLSKIGYRPADDARFDAILDSIRFIERRGDEASGPEAS